MKRVSLVFASLVSTAGAFSTGAGSCTWGGVRHGHDATAGQGGYGVFFQDANLLNVPGMSSNVIITGTEPYKGFSVYLEADHSAVNWWATLPASMQRHHKCAHVVTHTFEHGASPGDVVPFVVPAEASVARNVTLLVTVVQKYSVWFAFSKTYIKDESHGVWTFHHQAAMQTDAQNDERIAHAVIGGVEQPASQQLQPVSTVKGMTPLRLHSICMILAFAVCLPAAAHAAHLKASQSWFVIHRTLALCAFLLAFVGVLASAKHEGYALAGSLHAALGTATFCLMIVQIMLGVARPSKNAGRVRHSWKRAHSKIGKTVLWLGVASLCAGVEHMTRRDRQNLDGYLILFVFIAVFHGALRFATWRLKDLTNALPFVTDVKRF